MACALTEQVDALEQKQNHEAAVKGLDTQLAKMKEELNAAREATTSAVEAAVATEAAKLKDAVAEATKRSQQLLLTEMNQKADMRAYLRQLPHYLASVRRLQHERDHLKRFVCMFTCRR